MSASKTFAQDDLAVRKKGDFNDVSDGDAAIANGREHIDEKEREEGQRSSSPATTAACGRSASEIAKFDDEGGRTSEEAFLSGRYPVPTPSMPSAMLSFQPGDASSSGRAASRAGQGEQLLMRPLPILVVGEEKKRELATYVPPPKRRASTYLNDLERQNPTKLARIDVAPDHGSAQEALGHIKTEVEDEAMSTLDYGRSPTPPPPGARARYGQDHRTSGRPTPDCGVSIASYLRAQSLIGQPKSGYLVDRTVQSIQDQMNSYVCDSGPYETFQLLQVVDKKFNIDKKQWRGITEMQYKLDNLRRERVQKELSLGRNANREGQEALRLDTRATQGAREELRLDRLTDQGPRKELRGARLHVQGGQQASSLPVRGPVHAMAPPLMVLALPRLGMSPQGLDLAGTIMDEANHLLRQYSNVQLALSFQDMGDIVGLRRGPIN